MATFLHMCMKKCAKCARHTKIIKKGMCNTCYEYARRHKHINVYKLCKVEELTKIQHNHLTGLMLGDGSIELGKLARHARLCVARQTKDKAYVEWQSKIFENVCVDEPVRHKELVKIILERILELKIVRYYQNLDNYGIQKEKRLFQTI